MSGGIITSAAFFKMGDLPSLPVNRDGLNLPVINWPCPRPQLLYHLQRGDVFTPHLAEQVRKVTFKAFYGMTFNPFDKSITNNRC